MFKQGDLVKSKLRTDERPLFLMVLYDDNPSGIQFNGVVIKDTAKVDGEDDYEAQTGYEANNWYTQYFELCQWEDIIPHLNIKVDERLICTCKEPQPRGTVHGIPETCDYCRKYIKE